MHPEWRIVFFCTRISHSLCVYGCINRVCVLRVCFVWDQNVWRRLAAMSAGFGFLSSVITFWTIESYRSTSDMQIRVNCWRYVRLSSYLQVVLTIVALKHIFIQPRNSRSFISRTTTNITHHVRMRRLNFTSLSPQRQTWNAHHTQLHPPTLPIKGTECVIAYHKADIVLSLLNASLFSALYVACSPAKAQNYYEIRSHSRAKLGAAAAAAQAQCVASTASTQHPTCGRSVYK